VSAGFRRHHLSESPTGKHPAAVRSSFEVVEGVALACCDEGAGSAENDGDRVTRSCLLPDAVELVGEGRDCQQRHEERADCELRGGTQP
jgi:hypothetical protein